MASCTPESSPPTRERERPDGEAEQEKRGWMKEKEVEAKVIYLGQSHEQGF